MRLKFGDGLLHRIKIRTVRRQVAHLSAAGRKQPTHAGNFVGGEVVEDECVARVQLRTKDMLQVGGEGLGIHRTFHQEGRVDPVTAQGGDKGGGLPMTVWQGTQAAVTSGTAPIVAGHDGVQARFVQKDQLPGIPVWLLAPPPLPSSLNVGPILLGGARRFFYSSGPASPAGATRPSAQWQH